MIILSRKHRKRSALSAFNTGSSHSCVGKGLPFDSTQYPRKANKTEKNGTAQRELLQTQMCQPTNYDDELLWERYPNDR
jgi:hypothetical protein